VSETFLHCVRRTALAVSLVMLGIAARAAGPCDPAAGAAVFAAKCATCHSIDAGGEPIVGPTLFGVVNRHPATLAGFAYSPAMQARSDIWTPAMLDWFLVDPPGRVPGTYMAFSGVKNDAARAAVICFLSTAGATPKK